jgi:pilus assembly protein Flp/PilA
MGQVRRYVNEESGATAVEYAIMAGFIATVIVAAVQTLGASLIPIFTNIAAGIGS